MEKMYGPDMPIKTQKEWDEVFETQCQTTADTLKITTDQAKVRMYALFESGILEQGHPAEPSMMMMIDAFLTHPQWDNQTKHFGEKL